MLKLFIQMHNFQIKNFVCPFSYGKNINVSRLSLVWVHGLLNLAPQLELSDDKLWWKEEAYC